MLKIPKAAMIKKLLISFFLSIFLLVGIGTPYVHAQQAGPWYSTTFPEFIIKVYDSQASPPDEIFGERYTAAQVRWVVYSLIALILSPDGNTDRLSCLIGGNFGQCMQDYPLFGYSNFQDEAPSQPALAVLFSPQRSLSGVNYVREKLTNINIVPEANAQGFGFGALSPIRDVWRMFRDLTYSLFILIIIVFAFMIMFRVKLSPQTVVSVQSALPRIVITLILVTFSYAIAGFMVDLVYVAIGLIALVFSSASSIFPGGWSVLFSRLTDGPIINGVSTGAIGFLFSFAGLYFTAIMAIAFSATGISGIGGFISTMIAAILGLLFVLVFALWALLASIKILILLFKTYVSIILLVIFAPLQIGVGAITGQGFTSWLRNLAANLAVYPVVGALFMIALMFLASSYPLVQTIISNDLGIPVQSPFTPGQQTWYPPLTVGVQGGNYDPLPILWIIASIGVLAIIPKAGELIKSMIGGRPFEAGTAIGAAAGVMWTGAKAPVSGLYSKYYRGPRDLRAEAKKQDIIAKSREVGDPFRRTK